MSHEDTGCTRINVVTQHQHDLFASVRIQRAGRLVGKNDRAVTDQSTGEGIVPTTVPEVLFGAFERGDVTELLVQVPRAAREIAEVIDTEVDEATGAFWAAVADEAWVGLAVRVDDVVTYPDLLGDSWRVIATSQDVCEVLSVVEFAELYPDDVPLLADKDGEFWAAAAPSSPEVLWEDVEDVLAE